VRVLLRTAGPALSVAQARAWLAQHPVPADPPVVRERIPTRSLSDGLDTPDYQAWLARERPRLPALWATTYHRTGDASQADFAVAIRAVSLQLADHEVMAELRALMTPDRLHKHRPVDRYLAHTVAKARRLTGVVAPGVWIGGQFDPQQGPWANSV